MGIPQAAKKVISQGISYVLPEARLRSLKNNRTMSMFRDLSQERESAISVSDYHGDHLSDCSGKG